MRRISKRLAASGALDVVATAVPGMKDILVLGKVKSLERGPGGRSRDRRRARRRARHHVPALARAGCSMRCGSGRSASRRPTLSRCSVRSRALPGAARHRARRDARQRSDRHGVRDRGPRRRRARTRSSSTVATRPFSPASSRRPTRSRADAGGDRPLRRRTAEAEHLAHAAAFREQRYGIQREQIERLLGAAAAAADPSAVRVHARHPPRRSRRARRRDRRAGSSSSTRAVSRRRAESVESS